MKPHPRIRKTIKWGGAAMTVLLVAVWIGSGWWGRTWYYQGHGMHGSYVSVYEGRMNVGKQDLRELFLSLPGPNSIIQPAERDGFKWWFFWKSDSAGAYFGTPLWIIAAISFVITGYAFRLDTLARRRACMNLCKKCHYDRTGLAAGAVCPECGEGGHSV